MAQSEHIKPTNIAPNVPSSANGKRGNCEVCGKKITSSMYEGACSRACAQERLEYNFIRIPKQFARSLTTRYKEEEWEVELTAFANRHKYRADLVIKKFYNTQLEQSKAQ